MLYYECETWTLLVETGKSNHAFKCLRKIIIFYWKHNVCAWGKVKNLVGRKESLLSTIRRQKLWFSGVTCYNSLNKTNMRGTVEDGLKPGRQRNS